ncbi:unnamed protein product [Allacma fusca]|uniref:Insulin-degrading enzyme n=1 Tax=Allacma fusca TaxID=39272 RepID=A0A8J2Q7R5_9HEXA|nr:unnamed protein product [Allacma fusca]
MIISTLKTNYSDAGARSIGVSTLLSDVVKSPADKREYRAFTLENGLVVIVVSDPETDKSAAALDVMTGSLKDPVELPGLAHYLEHMLFLGTEKFPEENAYAKYLSENAGSTNAYTAGDNTCYYFDCSPDALEGAIDRFAQFFVSPLFTESGSEREVNAVNSEHEGIIPSDEHRKDAVNSFLSKQGHPYSSFGCGNKYTLWTHPAEKGINVRSELIRFYRENYSANIMKLAVIGKESLDELQMLVEKYFLDVKNYEFEAPHWPESPFGPDEAQTRIDILPIKDIRSLEIIFPIPDDSKDYKSGITQYVTSLVGHEGTGSLLSLLKKKGWATELHTSTEKPGRGFAFLYTQIELTPLGLEFVDEVVLHFFQYVEMLRNVGPQNWYWDELKTIRETEFRFQEDQCADYLVVDLVDQMTRCPVSDVWASRYLLSDYQPSMISEVVNLLNPNNVRVIVNTQDNKDKVDKTEEFFGTKYRYYKISSDVIDKWKTCGLHEDLHIPKPNMFVPTEFDLKPRDKETGIIPRIILEDELSRVWYLQDNEYLLPRGIIQLSILSPCAGTSPRNFNLVHLLENIMEDLVAEDCYSANMSGLSNSFNHAMDGLRIITDGYNDKLEQLFYFLLDFLLNFNSVGPRFEAIKEAFVRELRNWKDEDPSTHASAYLSSLSFNVIYSNAERLEAVNELTPENLILFAKKLLASVKFEWYIFGNYTEQEALAIHAKGMEGCHKFGSQPLFSAELAPRRHLKLPAGSSYLYTANHTTHSNSCIRMRLQIGMGEVRTRTLMLLVDHILSEPCFDILRTKEQLGYVVWCTYRRQVGVMSFDVVIQGEKHPAYLESRIENFLELMEVKINKMEVEEFQKYVQSLKVILLEKPKTLNERFSRLQAEIICRTYEFDADDKIILELDKITREEISNYFKKWISPHSTSRKKLTVHVISVAEGGAGNSEGSIECLINPTNQELITEIETWKCHHGYYPAPLPCMGIPPWKTRNSLFHKCSEKKCL